MNENPEGTPNPFNPNQNAASSGTPVDTTPVGSLDPTGRNMEQPTNPETNTPKPKKTGLIAAIITGAFALIIGTIALVIVLMGISKNDPVAEALKKIISGDSYKNITIDGDIDLTINSPLSPIKQLSINLNSESVVNSMINSSRAKLTLVDSSNNDYSAVIEEVYANSGDLYLKIEGIDDLLKDENFLNLILGITPTYDDTTPTNTIVSQLEPIFSIISSYDSTWLRVSTSELQEATGSIGQTDVSSSLSCLSNLAQGTNKNRNSALEVYSKYPFVISDSKNVLIASKQNPVYKINLDAKNLAAFFNTMEGTELGKSISACLNQRNTMTITESDAQNLINNMPDIYVEVNGNNDFTRLYLESSYSDGMIKATIDLGLDYPTSVNIVEPTNTTDLQTVIQALISGTSGQ